MSKQFPTPYGNVTLRFAEYGNGMTAIRLIDAEDGSPMAMLTVNLPNQTEALGEGEFYVKTWSENAEIAHAALQSGLFIDTGKRASAGYATASIWKLA